MNKKEDSQEYDIAIVGGGMVGGSLALALRNFGLKIAIIDKVPATAEFKPSFDSRAIALSLTSQKIFSAIGLWNQLQAFVTPINSIHVSLQGSFAATRLNPDAKSGPQIGYVCAAENIGKVIYKNLNAAPDINLITPTTVTAINPAPDAWHIHTDNHPLLKAKLLIAADGAKSKIRDLLQISNQVTDYQQTAVITNVALNRDHNNIAYERFVNISSPTPIAMLPFSEQRSAVIWIVPAGTESELLNCSPTEFCQNLQATFGYRVGKFLDIGKRVAFPLQQILAAKVTAPKAVLLGNAAHNLHPIAGQSFNLALREAATLTELIVTAKHNNQNINSPVLLDKYEQMITADRKQTTFFINQFVKALDYPLSKIYLARPLGFMLTDFVPPITNLVKRLGSGNRSHTPSLACGIDLRHILPEPANA